MAKKVLENLPEYLTLFYLFNPFIILSVVGKSTIILTNLAILFVLYWSLKGNGVMACFSTAVAAFLSFYPIALVVAIPNILRKTSTKVSKFT